MGAQVGVEGFGNGFVGEFERIFVEKSVWRLAWKPIGILLKII